MIGGGIGRLVGSGSGSGAGVGSGAAPGRITTGIEDSGRADAIGRDATLGTASALGSGTALGTESVRGSGIRAGTESTSGRTVITGSASGDAIAGSVGTGASVRAGVAAASGVRGEPVHATNKMPTDRTSRRMVNPPCPEARNSSANRPGSQRKQTVDAVHSASAGLTGRKSRPYAGFSMRFALIPPMPMAPIPGLASRLGG